MGLDKWTLIVLHLVIWSLLGSGIFFLATTSREMSVLRILGSTEKDLSLPVFAQFIVTQTLSFERPFFATELMIPLYLPSDPQPIKISLYQEGKLVTWWRYPFDSSVDSEGSKVAHLRFATPTLLQGKSELRFDGSSIAHDMQDHAPRLYTETFDGAYPQGNYRIAQNEKQGDIALEFIEQKTNSQLFWEKVQADPMGRSSFLLIFSSLLMLLVCLPFELVQLGKKVQQLLIS
jgi:hypothetical protein